MIVETIAGRIESLDTISQNALVLSRPQNIVQEFLNPVCNLTELRDYACRLSIASVCAVKNLLPVDLNTLTRSSPCVSFARQIAMYLAHTKFGISYDDVGTFFGRNRSTVAHACKVIEDLRDDYVFDDRISKLEYLIDAAMPNSPEVQRVLSTRYVGGLA